MRRLERRKAEIAERRQFMIRVAKAAGWVLASGANGFTVVNGFLSMRRAPGVVVEAVGTAAGTSTAIALSGVEAITVVEYVNVVIAPSTGRMG